MYSFLSRYGQLIALGVGAFITIIFFAIIGMSGDEFAAVADLPLREYNAKLSETSIFNFGLYATFALIFITTLAVLIFGILGIATDFKGSIKGLIGFAVVLLIFIIAYFVANSSGDAQGVLEVIEKINIKAQNELGEETINTVTAGRSSFISASLITTMILGALAFVGLIASEVWNLFR